MAIGRPEVVEAEDHVRPQDQDLGSVLGCFRDDLGHDVTCLAFPDRYPPGLDMVGFHSRLVLHDAPRPIPFGL